MKFKNSILSTVLAFAVSCGVASAQEPTPAAADTSSSKFLDKLYLGVGVGSAFSFTDVKQYPSGAPVFSYRSEYGYGANGFLGYQFNSWFALEGCLSYVILNGTRREDNVWFTGNVLQWDLAGRFNLTNMFMKSSIGTRKLDVYLIAGGGLSAFRAKRHVLVSGNTTDPLSSYEGYETPTSLDASKLKPKGRTQELSGVAGIGLSYKINPKLSILLDMKGYYVNTDKLDASVSKNPSQDRYTYSTLGVLYNFGGTKAPSNKIDEDSDIAKINELLEKLKDTDGDGVSDVNDKDNKTPKGVKVYADGTSVDTDGDGISDNLDAEKVSPCKEVDATGKSKDTDNDGVADCHDLEPNTAKGSQVDAKGKTISNTDSPSAPSTTGTPSSNGGVTPSASTGVASGLPSVFFDLNSSAVSYKNYPALTQVAQYLKANPKAKLVLVGNADKVGSAEYNKKLSEKRAQEIVDHLVKNNGVDKSRLSIVGKGSEEPISTKRNSEQNRRVDFMLSK